MTHVLCPNCKVVMVPAGNVCVDCAWPTAQQRQQRFEEETWRLEVARATQRDRYAEAAMAGLLARSSIMAGIDQHSPDQAKVSIVLLAFAFADEAMEQRLTRPLVQKGSSRS